MPALTTPSRHSSCKGNFVNSFLRFYGILALGLSGRYNGRMRNSQGSAQMHGTTVLCVRRDNKVVLIADGQVTMGDHVMKHTARKTRRLFNDKVVAGFAGSTADAITLF